jgi:histidinol phosphatase-like enzyme
VPRETDKVICVDFDGTIYDHDYPDVGPIKPGVIDALTRLREAGWWIAISSCRTKQQRFPVKETDFDGNTVETPFDSARLMAAILDRDGVPYDEILVVDKPYARYYVDDRGISLGCPRCGRNWPEIADRILEDQAAFERLMGYTE